MLLSKNLSLAEVVRSNTAARLHINNDPDVESLENLKHIALEVFQPLRDHFDRPIFVTSGYRSPKLNRAIGGSVNSQHSKGEALDIKGYTTSVPSSADLFFFIRDNLPFDQLIWEFGDDREPAWVHVSLKRIGSNRKQVLQAFRIKGKILYKHFLKEDYEMNELPYRNK